MNSPGSASLAPQASNARIDLAGDDRRTVQMQLEHLLAGVALRRRKRDGEPFVYSLAALVNNRCARGVPGLQRRFRAHEARGEMRRRRAR